ncbi:hypothetical protein [Agromyces sp. SYSU T0242]|uniref:hypothetical protein n=1 Tax=Agromyces litoreus TaxID=3158561 RepID=UPI0033939084
MARPGRTAPRAVVVPLALVVGCAIAGCAPAADAPGPLPDGLDVTVRQGRLDVPQHLLVVHFENSGDPLTVEALTVRSPALAPGMERDRPFDLGRDDAIDIRLDLPGSVCEGDPTAVEVDVRVTSADGESLAGTLEPADPFGTMARIADTDCLAEAVAAVAAIELPERLRTSGSGAGMRAWIDVRVAPVPTGDGRLTIDGVAATTLIGDEGGQDWELGIDVAAGDEPVDAVLAVRPARCDAHALADDKRGTILPFDVAAADGRSGRLEFAAGPSLKADLYAYYAERCELEPPSG